jgi:hypothetical protein
VDGVEGKKYENFFEAQELSAQALARLIQDSITLQSKAWMSMH